MPNPTFPPRLTPLMREAFIACLNRLSGGRGRHVEAGKNRWSEWERVNMFEYLLLLGSKINFAHFCPYFPSDSRIYAMCIALDSGAWDAYEEGGGTYPPPTTSSLRPLPADGDNNDDDDDDDGGDYTDR